MRVRRKDERTSEVRLARGQWPDLGRVARRNSPQIQRNCNFADSVLNIQFSVSQFLFQISRQFDARYTLHLLPNTADLLLFTLSQLGSRTNTMLLQYCIFRLQNPFGHISAGIGDMSTIRCVSYSTYPALIQRTSFGLRYVNTRPCQIRRYCSFAHIVINILLNVFPFQLDICRQFDARYTPHFLPNTASLFLFT